MASPDNENEQLWAYEKWANSVMAGYQLPLEPGHFLISYEVWQLRKAIKDLKIALCEHWEKEGYTKR